MPNKKDRATPHRFGVGQGDLPEFSEPMIPKKMAPSLRGANEKDPIHWRADGPSATRSRPHDCGRGGAGHRSAQRDQFNKVVSPQGRREQVQRACQRGLSQRWACGRIGVAPSTLTCKPRLPAKDAPVIEAMKSLSAQYPRYGHRRIRKPWQNGTDESFTAGSVTNAYPWSGSDRARRPRWSSRPGVATPTPCGHMAA